MDHGQQEEASSNIPHMHLFMSLKRRFPSLKDADITDSIQRFGLDEARCEVELARKSQEQHKSCYSSWNRNRSKSHNSSTNLSSPCSPPLSETPYVHTALSIHNGSSPPTLFPGQLTLNMSRGLSTADSNSNFVEPLPGVSPNSGAPAHSLQGLTPPGGVRSLYPDMLGSEVTFAVQASNGYSTKVKNEPISAPVIPDSREPTFEPVPPHRRSSADTVAEHYRKHPYPSSPRPSRMFTSPSSPTSPPVSSPTPTRSTDGNSPTTDTQAGTNPQPSLSSTPATVQEQMARKEKLREEVDRRIEDKIKLKTEIESLRDELETKRRNQKMGVIRSKQEIELIQQDNSRLQYVCDELERMILESGESPKTDQDGRAINDLASPTFQDNPRIPVQPLLQNAVPNANLSSGGNVAPTTSMTPCRKAPSPPISGSGITPPTSIPSEKPSGTEEGDKGWSCSKCTFLNSPYLNECEICSFPHFLGTPHTSLQSGGSLAAPNSGDACYCHHRHHYNLSHERSSTAREI